MVEPSHISCIFAKEYINFKQTSDIYAVSLRILEFGHEIRNNVFCNSPKSYLCAFIKAQASFV